jgi:hypothetical protein
LEIKNWEGACVGDIQFTMFMLSFFWDTLKGFSRKLRTTNWFLLRKRFLLAILKKNIFSCPYF